MRTPCTTYPDGRHRMADGGYSPALYATVFRCPCGHQELSGTDETQVRKQALDELRSAGADAATVQQAAEEWWESVRRPIPDRFWESLSRDQLEGMARACPPGMDPVAWLAAVLDSKSST